MQASFPRLSLLLVPLMTAVAARAYAVDPALPRVFLNTAYAPPIGKTITVNSGGNLQTAINNALPGDTILLQAGATFSGNFTLPNKSGTSWIYIRTATSDATFVPPGKRATPTEARMMAKLMTPNSLSVLTAATSAHHYRLVGLEITVSTSVTSTGNLVALGTGSATLVSQQPNNIVIDRCYIHGNATGDVKNGVLLNSASTAIIDSTIVECHSVPQESHAISGYNGPGPYKIVNNELSGSAETILFGGAKPAILNNIPSDIEIRRNRMFKPLKWRPGDPTYAGINWMCKNLFELKFAQRVLIDGNTFEQNWPSGTVADAAPQHGWAILFSVRDQAKTMPWATDQDITFTNNIVRKSNCGLSFYGKEGAGEHRIKIENNLFDQIGTGWGSNDRTGMFAELTTATDVTINHNTIINNGASYADIIFANGSNVGGFIFKNNIVRHGPNGVGGVGTATGFPTFSKYFSLAPTYVYQKNAMAYPSTGASSKYPAGNLYPSSWTSVGFLDYAGHNYRLSSTSPYRGIGTDLKDLGCDMNAIDRAQIPDRVAPLITNVAASAITASGATIAWTTNEASDSQIEYGATTAYGKFTAVKFAMVTAHSVALSGLAGSTTYHYRVRSRDAYGNVAIGSDRTLLTPAATSVAMARADSSDVQSAAFSAPSPVAATGSSASRCGLGSGIAALALFLISGRGRARRG
jgi:hypothetical protein